MAASSPDRPLYPQRGSYTAASLDRSGSFRENLENPILSALPSMSRSSSAVTQGDVLNFLQCLRFDPKSMVVDHKFNRKVEFRRLASVALGLPPDDSPSGSSKGKLLLSPLQEELKRLKAGLRDSSIKARERLKNFNEALSVINKCFPTIQSRKRSRSDVLSADQSNALFQNDRSVMGTAMGKIGVQSHVAGSGFDLDQQKSEERTKIAVPNKRTRTSMVDARAEIRANTPVRSSGNVDRDRDVLRLQNNGAIQGEDRTLTVSIDGWEKAKMRKKRSGSSVIKPDVSPSTVATKPIDGYRGPKQATQPRLLTEARSRLNDSHGFRPGIANGTVGVGKADGTSPQTGLGIRPSIPRTEQDNTSLVHDRRDRPTGSDKERVNLRAVNKTREDFSSTSPTPSTKISATARGPRSGSLVPKLSPVVQRATVANDWELSHCNSKISTAVGTGNRKRTPSARSSSPPVAHWAGQRPQKISRTARRTNFVPIISSNDENPTLDAASDVASNENGSGFARRVASNSPQHVKLKADHFSNTTLSESDESGAAEIKSRDKGKKTDDIDEKASQNVQKMSNLVPPPRKNKLVIGEELGDGVRRQGRTGRGLTSARSLAPVTAEKLGTVGTGKQLRSARLGFDKTESKAGRPPTRKLSDRKAYTRQKNTTISAADFLVGSDDGHEELLAAANAVINPNLGFFTPFWKQMESFFGYITDVDIAYLKQQANLGTCAPKPTLDVDSFGPDTNGFVMIEPERDTNEPDSFGLFPELLSPRTRSSNQIPLCQRLIAALISEEESEEHYYSENEDLKYDIYGSEFELDAELESSITNHRSSRNFHLAGRSALNGYRITALGRSVNEPDHNLLENDMVVIPESGIGYNFDHLQNGLHPDQAVLSGMACSELQYDSLSIDERLLLELQSVGLYPEPLPDLTQTGEEEINEDISRLEDKYHEQVSKKKGLLGKLMKCASETREFQEKEFEQSALDKLIALAYEKYMTCWRPNTSGGKGVSNKMAKQAALAFVKRTLERYQKFEDTGSSCFSEPLFRDLFLSGSSKLNDARPVDSTYDVESGKHYVNIPGGSLEVRVSAPMSTQQSNKHDIYSSMLPLDHPSEQPIGVEDTWPNRSKKRELLLDDVGGIGTSNVPSGIGSPLLSSAKGKRSERDREGKVNSREVLSRNGTTKIGRPASSNIKGERKPKAKPKQKTTQLSASVNGLLGKISEQPKATLPSVPKSSEMATSGSAKGKEELGLDESDDHEPLDLSHLQLPGMDVLGAPEDFGGQGQDFDSWFNIDDEGLQDHDDFMGGLEIPMDDLSDVNMMV